MEDNKNFMQFIRKATENIVTVTINGKSCKINIFFNISTESKLFDFVSETNDYRLSFTKIAYYLYLKTDRVFENKNLSEDDFLNATDEELTAIALGILVDNGYVKNEYDKIQSSNIYERFYFAHKNLHDAVIDPLQKMLNAQQAISDRAILPKCFESIIKTQKIFEGTAIPQWYSELKQITNITKNLAIPHFAVGSEIIQQQKRLIDAVHSTSFQHAVTLNNNLRLTAESAARIASTFDFDGVASAIKSFTTRFSKVVFDYPGIKSVLSSIPRYVVDIPRVTEPFIEQFRSISDSLKAPINAFVQALSNIDYSMLTYHKEWNEKHDTLVRFKWFYLNELPDDLVNRIFEKITDIEQGEVDQIIVNHFRNNRCAALKCIVQTWKSSRYFSPRKDIFNQALHCHSRGIYNASVTMLTLHIEGVITDFVRIAFNTPKFKAENALKDIDNFIGGLPCSTLPFSEYSVFFSVIDAIQAALTENFSLANPETASNSSRHKIAHGHAVEKETEANSLRCFLYLNELFRMFSVIDEELAMNSPALATAV